MSSSELDVSRETFDRLRAFEALLRRWTEKINLISKNTVADAWERHILDSVQIFDVAPSFESWADLGSGGGLPGIVVAILAAEKAPGARVTFVESDQRKCAFLRTALRELGLDGTVIAERIDDVAPLSADVLSARALADLDQLLGFARRHLKPEGTALFLKGAQWPSEDAAARSRWSYACEAIRSKTNPEAAILKIKDIARV